jgi:hypothetical protein
VPCGLHARPAQSAVSRNACRGRTIS